MMTMLEAAKEIQNLLVKAGYPTLAAGGFVRDNLLGREPKDIDLATAATPGQVMGVLLGLKIIPTGLKHGTVTVVFMGHNIEVTTLRVDKKCYGRDADVEYTKSFEEDAQRRDFTINGLFMDLNTGEVKDYVGGLADIESKTLRFIGSPELRIREDYLRILRFYRFHAVLGFDLEFVSNSWARELLPYLSYISTERVRDETLKLLVGEYLNFNAPYIRELLILIFPELEPCIGFAQNSKFHIYDVYTHIVVGVAWAARIKDPILSLAHLFHDVAKPFCHSRDEAGIDHFYGHDAEGERIAANMCHRLKLSGEQTERIKFIIANHMTLHQEMGVKGYRRFIARCNAFGPDMLNDLAKIYQADCYGMNLELKLPIMEDTLEKLSEAQKISVPAKDAKSPLSGQTIMQMFCLPPGEYVGKIKAHLEQKVIDGELNPEDCIGAREAARQFYTENLI